MYDLKNDPYQLKNLIDNPAFAAKKKELRKQLESMRKVLDESLPLKGKKPSPIWLPIEYEIRPGEPSLGGDILKASQGSTSTKGIQDESKYHSANHNPDHRFPLRQ